MNAVESNVSICLISCGQRLNGAPKSILCKVRLLVQLTSGDVEDVWSQGHKYEQLFSVLSLSPKHYFLIVFGHDGQKSLELRTEEETECDEWVEAIQQARYK